MVQEFHVVRCFTCQTFQVQQVKKVNKWSCKLCGEKQSLLKEFGRGSGADCRRHVQKLNAMRGAVMEEQEHSTMLLWEQLEEEPEVSQTQESQTQVSRWSKYLDTPEEAEPEEEEEEEEENVLMDRQQLHGSDGINRKRKRREGRTPEQSNWSSLKLDRPSARTTSPNRTSPPSLSHNTRTSLNHTNPPSLSHNTRTSLNHTRTSLNNTNPPSLNHTNPPGLNHTNPPGLSHNTRTSLNHTNPPGLSHITRTSLNHTSPPSKKLINPPSVGTGPVSRWARFLSSDCQEEEEEEEEEGPFGQWVESVSGR